MFDILYLRIIILLIACGVAAYTDHKTGYIYDWVSYPLIAIGLLINIFTLSFYSILSILVTTVLIYLIGLIFYKLGKIGGGDIKLFMGINLILPTFKTEPFFLWTLIFASMLSVLFVSVKYLLKLILLKKITLKKILLKKLLIFKSLFLFIFYSVFLYFAIEIRGLNSWIYLSLLPIFFGLIIIVFEKEIKQYIYLRKKPITKLEEGDVLAKEFVSKDLNKKFSLEKITVLEEKDLLLIKKRSKLYNIRTLPIYDNLPRFGPYILLGVLVVLIFFGFIF